MFFLPKLSAAENSMPPLTACGESRHGLRGSPVAVSD
jgi:hypothetical protein